MPDQVIRGLCVLKFLDELEQIVRRRVPIRLEILAGPVEDAGFPLDIVFG